MENKQLDPKSAFQVIYEMTGTLTLNRQDGALLDSSLRALAQLLPIDAAEDKTA